MSRSILSAAFFLIGSLTLSAQQAPVPAPAQPAPATPAAPRPAQPAARPAPRPAAGLTLTVQVTDRLGAPLGNTQVSITGPVTREGTTSEEGVLRLTGMRPGTYRLHFEREGSITLERDLVVPPSQPTLQADVALSPAPPPPKAPEPVKQADQDTSKGLPPPGDPKITPVPLYLEKNFIGREPRKDSLLGCTPTSTATLHQLREAWTAHTHDDADEWIYVVAGEGMLRIGGTEQKIQPGTFSLVPHTMSHTVLPQGRNPLIVISVIAGPACKS
jgi:mannose-6-phosphate isomerase-like protein (cupin superfamily)